MKQDKSGKNRNTQRRLYGGAAEVNALLTVGNKSNEPEVMTSQKPKRRGIYVCILSPLLFFFFFIKCILAKVDLKKKGSKPQVSAGNRRGPRGAAGLCTSLPGNSSEGLLLALHTCISGTARTCLLASRPPGQAQTVPFSPYLGVEVRGNNRGQSITLSQRI